MNGLCRVVSSLILGALVLAGCATPTPPLAMVPAEVASLQALRDVAIVVGTVSGGMETKSWDVGRIGNTEFQRALIETLQKAGARASTTQDSADAYVLTGEIASQDIAGSFDNTITLLVHYSLKNPKGERIWTENILSEKELSAKEVPFGQERIRNLQTSAAQSNFATLIDRLGKAIDADRRSAATRKEPPN